MAKNYYFIDDSEAAGQSTLSAIKNESATLGIGASTDISVTSLQVGAEITANDGVVTAVNGFISDVNATPIKITLNDNIISFTAVGIGSTHFTLS
jgi:hypothetical protein